MKILLREYKISDLDRHLELLNQNGVYSSKRIAMKRESVWLKKAIGEYKKKKPQFYVLAILLNDKIIGNVIAEKLYLNNGTADVGFWIGKEYWGKGYTSRALKLFLEEVGNKFEVYKFHASHLVNNPASRKVLEKNGFKRTGRRNNKIFYKLELGGKK